ncbi:MAG: tktC [Bacillales bacterium]|nr:tktC [Bacillales bacterium]
MSNILDHLSVNTIRTLSIDAINKANSGHPGMPMGAAPMAYELWANHMNHNPKNPNWFNRDRFVLSAGHGSMLLYSLLHLSGYGLTIEDLKEFRQWGSKTPGHPEYGHTVGVEATTGPLGQGISMAVGMAMAERHLAATYNKNNYNVVDHYTYTICGDGDLMEGVSAEACSLAGHLKLDRLVVLYDSNDISLDGDLNRSMSESVKKRFEAYGWQYLRVEDGNNLEEISRAISLAKQNTEKPTLIEVRTTIGFGSPTYAGTSDVHGSPLGLDETKLTKSAYEWLFENEFHVPEEVYNHFEKVTVEAGATKEQAWNDMFGEYTNEYPELANQLLDAIAGKLPENFNEALPKYEVGKSVATRSSSGDLINAISNVVPQFIGGSADLAGSNKTTIKSSGDFTPESFEGKNIWFGVREFAMGAALNGMALHGGLKVFGGTFFVFSDYIRPAVRLSALMQIPVTYVFTHDSIAVGEDGPTHEPVEHLASFRAMPGLCVLRPADANESAAAWQIAVESKDTPTVLVFTRQNLKVMEGSSTETYSKVKKGAYIISKSKKETPDALLLATGSEVNLAISAQEKLESEGISVSVVSMPSWDLFDKQSQEYKNEVLPKNVRKRLAIEMGSSLGWHKYAGDEGSVLAIDTFGASAPGEIVMEKYGFSVDNVVLKVKEML